MSGISVTFGAVDEISSKFEEMASAGTQTLDAFERLGSTADSAYSTVAESATGTATAVDMATQATEHWTEALGNYDKGAMEAVYSTEELVEMGYKTADALEEQEQMFTLCEKSANYLSKALESTTDIEKELTDAQEQAAEAANKIINSDQISIEIKQEFAQAGKDAAEAVSGLMAAQDEATAAMDNYNMVMSSGTTDLGELEAAAERAYHAAEELAEANGRATDATEELSKVSESAGEEMEKIGETGEDAVNAIAGALASAGITAAIKEISESAYELVEAFSEAEKTVVLATGATENALKGLEESMMDAYATAKSATLEDTAGAVGEINTRLGLTGEGLEKVTGQFLDFANVTGGNAVSSVRSVTQLMNQWNVGADELENTLNRLTYAGQVSGISVDALSSELTTNKAVLDQLGFSMDESIAMFSKFELAGTATTAVMTGFRTALSSGAVSSLSDLNRIFEQISSGAIDAADAADIFGQRAATHIVNAVNSGVFSLDEMVKALEETDGVLETTAAASQTLDEKWQQSSHNISAAFTSAIEPMTNKLSSGLADVMDNIGDFLNKHPAVTKAISVVGVGLATMAAGIAGVTFVTTVAIPAVTALGVAVNSAIWPITAVAVGLSALTAGIVYYADAAEEANDVSGHLTSSSQKMADEIDRLQVEYEEAVEVYGKNSEQALELKFQIDDLTESFEANKTTIGDLVAKADELGTAISDIHTKYEEAVSANAELEYGSERLIEQLMVISTKSMHTGSELELMQSIVDSLNGSYEGLNLTLDKTNGKLNLSAEDLFAAVQQQAEEANKKAATDSLMEALQKFQDTRQNYLLALGETSSAWDTYEQMEEQWKKDHPIKAALGKGAEMNWDSGLKEQFKEWEASKANVAKWSDDYEELVENIRTYCEELGYSQDETDEFITSLEESSDAASQMADSLEDSSSSAISSSEAVSNAINEQKSSLEELATKYDEAYQAAYESIDGQIGLFDTMKTESEQSVADMQAAMETQIEYLNRYNENLQKASDFGLSEGLVAKLSDGSEESAGQLDVIINKIEELGGTTEGMSQDAQAFIDSFNSSFAQVDEAKEAWSNTVAEMETDFSDAMDQIQSEMGTAIDNMDMSAEAAAAARDTMNAYISTIKQKTPEINSALGAINFTGKGMGLPVINPPVAEHADGGIFNTPHYGVFAEDGPEAFIPIDGSDNAIGIWEETGRQLGIYDKDNGSGFYVAPPDESGTQGTSDKNITLRLEGAGEIRVKGDGKASKDEILNVLMSNLKGTLMDIIQQEIMEEGDLSYEF